ncbi:MAG TPA: hypothetical protein VNZ68_10175 [Rhodocyclaceae bacterium]|nr:hypothetical protein [Rhodocyclaceae bacterium]
MKKIYALLLSLPMIFALGACNKSPDPQLSDSKDTLKDATDSRPNEPVRDSLEDAGDKLKEGAGNVKDAVKGD